MKLLSLALLAPVIFAQDIPEIRTKKISSSCEKVWFRAIPAASKLDLSLEISDRPGGLLKFHSRRPLGSMEGLRSALELTSEKNFSPEDFTDANYRRLLNENLDYIFDSFRISQLVVLMEPGSANSTCSVSIDIHFEGQARNGVKFLRSNGKMESRFFAALENSAGVLAK